MYYFVDITLHVILACIYSDVPIVATGFPINLHLAHQLPANVAQKLQEQIMHQADTEILAHP